MKKVFALMSLAALLMSSSSAFAWSPSASISTKQKEVWNGWDSTLEVAYLITHAADWGQTRNMTGECGSGAYVEANPVLGTCPSAQTVNAYFLGTALIHAGISYILPTKYRRIFQTATIAAQIGVVSNNTSIGFNIDF